MSSPSAASVPDDLPRVAVTELLRVHHCETALYADFSRHTAGTRENEHDTTASELSHVVRSDSGAPQLNPEVVALLEAAQASCVADMRNMADADVEIRTAQGTEYYPLARLIPVLETLTERYEFLRASWREGVALADIPNLLSCGDCPACAARVEAEAGTSETLDEPELVPHSSDDSDEESWADSDDFAAESTFEGIPAKAQHPYRVRPATPADDDEEYAQLECLRERLAELEKQNQKNRGLSAENTRLAMLLSGIDFYRREKAPFWRDHLRRLHEPYENWANTRNCVIFESVETATDWERVRGAKMRTLRAVATLADSHTLKADDTGHYLLYSADDAPAKAYESIDSQVEAFRATNPQVRVPDTLHRLGFFGAKIMSLEPCEEPGELAEGATLAGGGQRVVMVVAERIRVNDEEHAAFPLGLTPGAPVTTKQLEAALMRVAVEAEGSFPNVAATGTLDLIERRPPRLKTRESLPQETDFSHAELPTVEAVLAAVRDLDRSYVAVQGPPGSGKTFLGSQVIARLVAEGAKVGVVAQSHAVVENMLAACLERNLFPAERVMRAKGKSQLPDYPWIEASDKDLTALLDNSGRSGGEKSGDGTSPGVLFGGTAWDFANPNRIPEGSLDLLVIDEAGQFSLANTLAVGRAARNLLLLGDPQQLPQVAVGEHPYPLDTSALGWLSGGQPVLPAAFGYFLQVTWRMHPQLCAPVSALSYGGKLHSAAAASERTLKVPGREEPVIPADPGLYMHSVHHEHCTVRSEVEAAAVTRLAGEFVGALWTAGADHPARKITGEDIVVVAAYNAQVDTIAEHLRRAGLLDADGHGVRVGTVDKFQGQQAPVTIMSMASSNAGMSGRGAEFLLSPNRLNVALSRGQWCSVLVASDSLHRFVPQSIPELLALGGYLGLARSATSWESPAIGGRQGILDSSMRRAHSSVPNPARL